MKFLLETMHKTLNTGRCRTNLRKYLNCSFHDCAGLIEKNTLTSYKHLTPEIALKLITPECELWNQPFTETSTQSLGEPYWAFYWPGGQCLARYILDNPVVVKQKKVLDFGCGSGALSIAALKSGAKIAVANDVDTMAITATQVNARLNGVSPIYCSDNLVGSNLAEYDVILVGDMLYDTMHSTTISTWLMKAFLEKRTVLIGDPGRGYLDYSSVFGKSLFQLAKYELDQATKEENNGFFQANVFTLL